MDEAERERIFSAGDKTFDDLLKLGEWVMSWRDHPDPRGESIRIFRWLRGPDAFNRPLPAPSDIIPEAMVERFSQAAEHRSEGAPFQYAVGWAGFRHLMLHIDKRALVPRPETEGLVDLALTRVRTGVAADIGTGSGAIALSLKYEGEFGRVIGTDISQPALAVARENSRSTGLDVSWRMGDMLEPLRDSKVDLLVSNPPYLSVLEYDELDLSVKEWEPATALIGGPTGLEPYRRLFAGGSVVMNPGGWIAVEIDARRDEETVRIAGGNGWRDVRVYDDLFGRPRYLLARWEIRE